MTEDTVKKTVKKVAKKSNVPDNTYYYFPKYPSIMRNDMEHIYTLLDRQDEFSAKEVAKKLSIPPKIAVNLLEKMTRWGYIDEHRYYCEETCRMARKWHVKGLVVS